MKNIFIKLFLGAALSMATLIGFSQGITTSEINGSVTSKSGESLPGATVMVVHNPTGTQSGTITNSEGLFRLPNLNVGGPYTVKVSFIGYHMFTKENVYLSLGQTFNVDVTLIPDNLEIEEILVLSSKVGKFSIFDGNRTGTETVLDREQIEALPSISGNLNDFLQMTPQATFHGENGLSIAGMNNKMNSLMIDGTVNNDVFGLTDNGMNGGQAGVSPISYETIDQFQVTIAPFDVRMSGFAGGGINAVTKSGTNQVKGSVYYKFRNESLAGKTPTDRTDIERTQLADFSAKTYGFTLGGPILKNKLFYFVNAEIQRDETPKPFEFAEYTGASTQQEVDALRNYISSTYGYETGGYSGVKQELRGEKILAKINWNINEKHSLMARHQYTKGESLSPSSSGKYSIYFENSGVFFPSVTHSSFIELKSHFSDKISNNLKLGYSYVHDDRDPMGADFPGIVITDGAGRINFGGEVYSSGNELKQKILTITDNFQYFTGNHSFTFGTHNEFYSMYNLFVRRAFGYYAFDSVQDFYDNTPTEYRISYSLVDDVRGDGSAAAADFKFMQLGLYAQDEYQASKDLKFTIGLRVDMPIFNDDPLIPADFNSTVIPELEKNYDLSGAMGGSMPKTQLLFSPRVGFNWDVNGESETQVRGGLGIFTSRVPFVWPAGSYTNNGMMVGEYRVRTYKGETVPPFQTDVQNMPIGSKDQPIGSQIDLYAEDFKFPQMFKGNLAVDQKLPAGIIGSLELLYTKTLNNVIWQDVNLDPTPSFLTGPDSRITFKDGKIVDDYGQILLAKNTNKGFTYNITATLRKDFENGLKANVSWNFGRAKSIFDGTSSQNSSQWNYLASSPVPINEAELAYSVFDQGHRILATVSYEKEFLKHLKSRISLIYNGQQGRRFSYIYDDYYAELTNQGYGKDLVYIPVSSAQINFGDGSTVYNHDSQEFQDMWNDFDEYISQDAYLKDRRGKYTERNGAREPWFNVLDMNFAQDLFVNVADRKQTLRLGIDIFNFTNMLNKDWGRMTYVSDNQVYLLKFEGFKTDGSTPYFSFNRPYNDEPWGIDDVGLKSARWQAQISIKYIF